MPFLKNTWYVAAWANELVAGKMLRRQVLNEFYVLFRGTNDIAKALVDRCPHRFAPLSMGKLVDDGAAIQCPYHGLRFNNDGHCVHNPHGDNRIPKAAVVAAPPVVEKYSAIWVWLGDANKADAATIPEFDFLVPETHAVACDMIKIASDYELETDNILDLSHIEYMHPLFSSEAVSKGNYECVQDGETIWSKRFMSEDDLPPFLHNAFGFAPGQKADRWLNARWNAPATMALWSGAVESGLAPEDGREVAGAHIFTPETDETTHYFFAASFPRSIGPQCEQMASASLSAATGPDGVFTAEDKPMIEAQAENMQGREFWAMKPVLLSIDAAAVRARRTLARMIDEEQKSQP